MPNDTLVMIGLTIAGLVVGFLLGYFYLRSRKSEYKEIKALQRMVEARDAKIAMLEKNFQKWTLQEKEAMAKLQKAFHEQEKELVGKK